MSCFTSPPLYQKWPSSAVLRHLINFVKSSITHARLLAHTCLPTLACPHLLAHLRICHIHILRHPHIIAPPHTAARAQQPPVDQHSPVERIDSPFSAPPDASVNQHAGLNTVWAPIFTHNAHARARHCPERATTNKDINHHQSMNQSHNDMQPNLIYTLLSYCHGALARRVTAAATPAVCRLRCLALRCSRASLRHTADRFFFFLYTALHRFTHAFALLRLRQRGSSPSVLLRLRQRFFAFVALQ
jgi:hypothetical protein